MPFGVTAATWDQVAQQLTVARLNGANIVFGVSDIPQNVQRTVSGLQTWCDANLQTWLAQHGFTEFIRVRVRSVAPTIFDYVVGDTAASIASYNFDVVL